MGAGLMRVLAVGAAGKFAGLVVPALAKRGALVRGMVRDAAQADGVVARGASEIAVADLEEEWSLRIALEDVEAVFYIAPVFHPDEAALGRGMVAAAKAAGVRRFVFSSVIHPSLGALVNHSAKAPVEDAILQSGMEYVLLQPTLYFQNLQASWPRVVEQGVLAEPWSCETRFSRVDFRDVAEVAAIALTEDRLLYGTYELCAEGDLDRRGVARLIGEVLGREIEAAVAENRGTARLSKRCSNITIVTTSKGTPWSSGPSSDASRGRCGPSSRSSRRAGDRRQPCVRLADSNTLDHFWPQVLESKCALYRAER